MADFAKEREEVVKLAVGFSDALDTGDSLSAVSSVEIVERSASGWTDVSSEFGSPSGSISGDTVEITLGAASSGNQEEGIYYVRVTVTTANSETLISTPALSVTATADVDAP